MQMKGLMINGAESMHDIKKPAQNKGKKGLDDPWHMESDWYQKGDEEERTRCKITEATARNEQGKAYELRFTHQIVGSVAPVSEHGVPVVATQCTYTSFFWVCQQAQSDVIMPGSIEAIHLW